MAPSRGRAAAGAAEGLHAGGVFREQVFALFGGRVLRVAQVAWGVGVVWPTFLRDPAAVGGLEAVAHVTVFE